MKTRFRFYMLMAAAIAGICFTSCSKDDDGLGGSDGVELTGNWSGKYTYVNPVGGRKFLYFYLTFESDKTGEFGYETPTGESFGYFTYSVSKGTITCMGTRVYSDGDIDDFTWKFKLEEGRLTSEADLPARFILTKDGSVETDENGEIIDLSEELQGVWIRRDKKRLLYIDDNDCIEYSLDTTNLKGYNDKWEYQFYYDKYNRELHFGSAIWSIDMWGRKNTGEISSMVISNKGTLLTWNKGTESDIPTELNLKGYLVTGASAAWESTSNSNNFFQFRSDGYLWHMNYRDGRSASGTWSVSGNSVICNFDKVTSTGGYYEYEPYTKRYTIEVINETNDRISLTSSDGEKWILIRRSWGD